MEKEQIILDETDDYLDADDIDEAGHFTYEVWLLGYNEDQTARDAECLIDDGYDSLSEAKKCYDYFRNLENLKDSKFKDFLDSNPHVEIRLEEVLEDSGEFECTDIPESEMIK